MEKIYKEKYLNIPECAKERLEYLEESLNLSDKNRANIASDIDRISKIEKRKVEFTIYELPLATDRPRGNFLKRIFYVNNTKLNKDFMKTKMNTIELKDDLIITDTIVTVAYYLPIPDSMRKEDKMLAEMGYIDPLQVPDNDNVYKTYTDMLNELLILDDRIIVKSIISKHYSIKPRVEVTIEYYKDFKCKRQEDNIKKSKSYKKLTEGKKTT